MPEIAFDYFAHKSSYIDPGARIGFRTKIWHFCHVMAGGQIGNDCTLGQNVFVASGVYIGDRVKIQNNVSVYSGVSLGDDVFVGPSVVFTNVLNPRSEVDRKGEFISTVVKRGTTIGANATIVCGVLLGEYSFVGAGAVVHNNLPAYSLVYGVPAKLVGWMCRCGERLTLSNQRDAPEKATCHRCKTNYIKQPGYIVRPVEAH